MVHGALPRVQRPGPNFCHSLYATASAHVHAHGARFGAGLVPPTPQPAPEDATAMETETGAEAAPACKPEKPHVGFYIAKEYNNGWTYLVCADSLA